MTAEISPMLKMNRAEFQLLVMPVKMIRANTAANSNGFFRAGIMLIGL